MYLFGSHFDVNTEKYRLRYHENEQKILLFADRIYVSESEKIPNVYIQENQIAEFDKSSKQLKGLDILKNLRLYFYTQENFHIGKSFEDATKSIPAEQKWILRAFEKEAFSDFMRRCICYINNNLVRKCFVYINSDKIIHLINYLDHLDTIENLCSVSEPTAIWNQIENQTLVLRSGSKLKSKVGLPIDIIESLNSLGLDSHLSKVQGLVMDEKINPDQLRLSISMMEAIPRFKRKRKLNLSLGPDFRTSSFFGDFLEAVENGLDPTQIIESIGRENLMFHEFCEPCRLSNSLMSYIRDISVMMTKAGKQCYLEQNIDKWHAIVSRNMKVILEKHPEEYTEAVKEINKRSMIVDGYLIKCPETEDELVNIGMAYNNCLPTYRDRIINRTAIIYSVYKVGKENEIPEVTFEVTSNLEFVQIRTFNDANVEDETILDILKKWRTLARRISV